MSAPITRASRLAVSQSLLRNYPGWDGDEGNDVIDRFLLVEQNVGGSDPPYWATTHKSRAAAAKYHDGQEYAEDWCPVLLYDLDTGETFVATTQFVKP